MKGYTLGREMTLPRGIRDTFAFFEDPHNLALITPPWLSFQVTSAEPVRMRRGAVIRYRIRWLGLPFRWKTIITEYDPPHSFTDEQAEGPYALWRHRHTFRETAEGTAVSDLVEYRMPFGIAGALAHRLLVRRQLEEIFDFRQRALRERLTGGTASGKPRPRSR